MTSNTQSGIFQQRGRYYRYLCGLWRDHREQVNARAMWRNHLDETSAYLANRPGLLFKTDTTKWPITSHLK
jgi:hypothetical protein